MCFDTYQSSSSQISDPSGVGKESQRQHQENGLNSQGMIRNWNIISCLGWGAQVHDSRIVVPVVGAGLGVAWIIRKGESVYIMIIQDPFGACYYD
jgi:hypothetical protein